MSIDDYRVEDFQAQVSAKCHKCAGVSETSNGRKTWLTCFADRQPALCKGPYTMGQFLNELEKDDEV